MKRKICACLFLVLILVVCVHIGYSIKRNIEYQNRKTTFHTTCTSEFERVFNEHGISVDSINIWGMNTNYGIIKMDVRLSEVGKEYQVIYTALREAYSCASDLTVDDDYFFIEDPNYDREGFNGCNFLEVTYIVDHQIYEAYYKDGYQTLEIDDKIVWEEESEGYKALREEFGIPENTGNSEKPKQDDPYISVGPNKVDSADSWYNIDGSRIVCRRNGCGKTPVYSDWNRRYCTTHINETHFCRYPGCLNEISNKSTGRYCWEHN